MGDRYETMSRNVEAIATGKRDCTDPLSVDDFRSAVACLMGRLIAHAPTQGHAKALRVGHVAYMDAIPYGEE